MGNSFDQLKDKISEITFSDAKESNTKRENANINGNTPMGTMLHYGTAVSKAFCEDELLKPELAEAHKSGRVHYHDEDFFNMGTTTCCQIDLEKLFNGGFSTGHGYLREPQSINSYAALTAIAIQANQNDQHGGQAIPAFEHYMVPGVIKTYRAYMKRYIKDYANVLGIKNGLLAMARHQGDMEEIDSVIDDIKTIAPINEEDNIIKLAVLLEGKGFNKKDADYIVGCTLAAARVYTEKDTHQAMEGIVHNMNTMHSRAGAQVPFSSLNFGTDTSPEGRLVMFMFLQAVREGLGHGETPIFPISIFKVKEGINYNPEDPNYDVYKYALQVSSERLFPNFSFLDAPFNAKHYVEGDFNTEIAYMGCRTRVMSNICGPDIVTGRGNLSFSSVNLPRLGLRHGIALNEGINYDGFFSELEDAIDICVEELIDRFKHQCSKKAKNFPFLMGQGVWIGSDELKPDDTVGEILKHGTLSVGFIGLAECLVALIGKHHGESEEAQELGLKIISHMKERLDNYSKIHRLNFSLLGTPAEGLSGRFVNIDKEIFGEVPGVTDREFYTNSFHVPVYYDISAFRKIDVEAPYHALTPAGHITYIELDGNARNNPEAFEAIIRHMKEAGIGYGAINHPVDRCPRCGYNGVIGEKCPHCGAVDGVDVIIERIRRITGYLVGTTDQWGDSKQAEEKVRTKHSLDYYTPGMPCQTDPKKFSRSKIAKTVMVEDNSQFVFTATEVVEGEKPIVIRME